MDNHFAVRNKRVTNQTIKSISNNTIETRWMEHLHDDAPAVSTFMHEQDFSNKTDIPFMTNDGWTGHVIKDMKKLCTGAKVASEWEI